MIMKKINRRVYQINKKVLSIQIKKINWKIVEILKQRPKTFIFPISRVTQLYLRIIMELKMLTLRKKQEESYNCKKNNKLTKKVLILKKVQKVIFHFLS